MNVLSLHRSDSFLVMLTDDLNIATIERFESEMSNLLEKGSKYIVVEFTNVRYLISEAVGTLISVKKIIENRGGRLLLCSVNEYVRWVLASCCGDNAFAMFENIEVAVSEIDKIEQ